MILTVQISISRLRPAAFDAGDGTEKERKHMNLWGAVSHVFRNYANFSGRASRSEFWYFYLFNTLVWIGIFLLFPIAVFTAPIYSLAVFIPNLAVTVRRLHDTNRSGAYLFFAFVPLVGFILLIVWLAENSFPGPNAYGGGIQYTTAPGYRGAPSGGTLGVKCLAGPLQGHTYPVGAAGVTIGRDMSCSIRLPETTPGVSSRHCSVKFGNGSPVITDLGSKYGTFLSDGRKLPVQYPFTVQVGTRFFLGGNDVQFELVIM